MRKAFTLSALGAGVVLAAVTLAAGPAGATNGYLGICVGAKNCGMGGAGVALPQDATSGALNPALMGRVGNEVTVSPGWFHPERSLDRSGASDPANRIKSKADEDSHQTNFIEGSGGINYHVTPEIALGLTVAGSGGMHTKYDTPRTQVAGAGESSVRYRLLHIKPNVAWTPNDWSSYGASLNIGWADFKTNMANSQFQETVGANQPDTAWGIGVTLGGVWDMNDKVSFGLSLSSPTWFQDFDKYPDVFAGSLDVPANGTIGVVYHATPDTDIAFDVKYVAWSWVFPIANGPGNTAEPGGGFGWESEPVFMLGAQHRLNKEFTIRAGYNYGPSPIPNDKVFANALFPAVTEHHITVGASYEPAPKWELTGSFFYAFNNKQTDDGTGDAYSVMGEGVSVSMWQMGAQVGISYKF